MPFNGGIYEIEGYDILPAASPPHRVWNNKLIKVNKQGTGWRFMLHEAHMIENFTKKWFTPIVQPLVEGVNPDTFNWRNPLGTHIIPQTIADLRAYIQHHNSDYTKSQLDQAVEAWKGVVQPYDICECGAEKANTTHSDWCPKHG